MFRRYSGCKFLLGFLVCLPASPVVAQSWDSQLYDGSRIEVDVSTNKATHYGADGSVVPLWNGVHELEDGRTVIVRDGVMVPNREVLSLRQEPWREEDFIQQGFLACDKLVRKACGLADECADASGCGHARSLRTFAEQELEESSKPGFGARFAAVPAQCRDALLNETLFPPCGKEFAGGELTPCAQLVRRICGDQQQCRERASCQAVRDLLEREYDERLANGSMDAAEPTSEQCRMALADDQFAVPCAP